MRREGGYSYVVVMFLVAVLSLVSVRALENTLTAERREKEAQLLLVGEAYRDAIRSYYENGDGTEKVYPPTLAALLRDGRASRVRRPLRKLYRDPITGTTEWGIIVAEDGGVKGVFSLASGKPIKTGFTQDQAGFANAVRYRQWRFEYEPKLKE
jgi:type II secretory pathway pseudopilin PulG